MELPDPTEWRLCLRDRVSGLPLLPYHLHKEGNAGDSKEEAKNQGQDVTWRERRGCLRMCRGVRRVPPEPAAVFPSFQPQVLRCPQCLPQNLEASQGMGVETQEGVR